MNTSMRKRSLAAIVAAAVLIPAASAAASVNDPFGTIEVAAPTAPQPQSSGGDVVLRRDGAQAAPFVAEQGDTVVLRRDGSLAEPAVADASSTPSSSDGFDWGDAAIGAGAGIAAAAALVAAGSRTLRRRRGRAIEPTTAAPSVA